MPLGKHNSPRKHIRVNAISANQLHFLPLSAARAHEMMDLSQGSQLTQESIFALYVRLSGGGIVERGGIPRNLRRPSPSFSSFSFLILCRLYFLLCFAFKIILASLSYYFVIAFSLSPPFIRSSLPLLPRDVAPFSSQSLYFSTYSSLLYSSPSPLIIILLIFFLLPFSSPLIPVSS